MSSEIGCLQQAEAHQWAEQVSSGASAMQSALDSYEPGARPFSPPPGSAPLQRFSPIGVLHLPPALPRPCDPPCCPIPACLGACLVTFGAVSGVCGAARVSGAAVL